MTDPAAPTPSQVLLGPQAPALDGPGVEGYLTPRASRPVTLAEAADRIRAGTPLRDAVADFLDDLRWALDRDDAHRRVMDEPQLVGVRTDAYLAALAEHVCSQRELSPPAWSQRAETFLDRFWFPSNTPAMDARAVVESPGAFRRRGIFIGAGTLRRV